MMNELKLIKEFCEKHEACKKCIFKKDGCIICNAPAHWDLEKIAKGVKRIKDLEK